MKTMQIPYQNCHVTIKCGENIAETELKSLSQIRSLLIITDDKLKTLYSHIIGDLPVIIVPEGEKAKSIETYSLVIRELLNRQIDKTWVLVALGGGSISDLTGFVANTYKQA